MKSAQQQDISLLNINLSNARSENESYDAYRERLTTNKQILKTYFSYGREGFRTMFPEGVATAMKQAQQEAQSTATPTPEPVTATPEDSPVEYRLTGV